MPYGKFSRKRKGRKAEERYDYEDDCEDVYEDVYEEIVYEKIVHERWVHEETGVDEITWENSVRGRKRAVRTLRESGLAETDADSGVSDSCSDTTTTETFANDDASGEEIKPRRTGCYSLNLKQIPPHANDVTSTRPGNHLHRSAPPNLETTRTRTRARPRRKGPSPARRSSAKVTDECSSSLCGSSSCSEAESECTYECKCGYRCKCRSPCCEWCFDEDYY